ncbi:MAG: hypothetical protein LUI12_12215 [Clostridiales bacterium]|nr:hypothetical protein [Clostridiales bacterium]
MDKGIDNQHIILDEKGLVEKLHQSSAIFIYGAGIRGKRMLYYLKWKGFSAEAFLVTALDNPYSVDGVPVWKFEDAIARYDDYMIIVACDKRSWLDIIRTIEKKDVYDYLLVEEGLYLQIRKYAYDYIASTWSTQKQELQDRRVRIGYLSPGYLDTTYAEERLIINKLKSDVAEYVALPKELGADAQADSYYEPRLYIPNVDVIHTFNTVCVTDVLWCASFETNLPRIFDLKGKNRETFERLIDCILKNNCLGLFPLCQNAYEIQKSFLLENAEDVAKEILCKTEALHPPQPILLSQEEEEEKCSREREELVFIFIGNCFFIKGGREIINALSYFEGKFPFRLILISSFLYDDFFTHTAYDEMLLYKKIVQEKPWIEYYNGLPNEKVLKKCKEADVGLLPSFADTYGYSVLEMQAGGCPVITTNIRALPELNDGCGWMCELPVDANQCCQRLDMNELSSLLEKQLINCFQQIFEQPEIILDRRRASLARIRRMHDPDVYARRLSEWILQK